jgi:hypothetical protein
MLYSQEGLSRYIAVDDIWIPLGESLLIEMFSPVWNVLVDGFGNHDPGKGRYNQQRSPWVGRWLTLMLSAGRKALLPDKAICWRVWGEIHPGRAWAAKCQSNKRSVEQMLEQVRGALNKMTDGRKAT